MKNSTTNAGTSKAVHRSKLGDKLFFKALDIAADKHRVWTKIFARRSTLNREIFDKSLLELDHPRTRLIFAITRAERACKPDVVRKKLSTLVIGCNKGYHNLRGTHRRLPRYKNLSSYQKLITIAPAAVRQSDRELSFFTLILSDTKRAELELQSKPLSWMAGVIKREFKKAASTSAGAPDVVLTMETTESNFIHFHGLLLTSDSLHENNRKVRDRYLAALKIAGGEDWEAPLKGDGTSNAGYHQAEFRKVEGENGSLCIANYLLKQGHEYSITQGFNKVGEALHNERRELLKELVEECRAESAEKQPAYVGDAAASGTVRNSINQSSVLRVEPCALAGSYQSLSEENKAALEDTRRVTESKNDRLADPEEVTEL